MIGHHHRFLIGALVFVLGAVALTPLHLSAQDQIVVQIDPLENRSDEARLDPLGSAVRDGVGLTLQLLGRYRVTTVTPTTPSYAPADLQERAIRKGIDNIIFGAISQLEDGGYRISLAVYDRAEGEITFQDEVTFESLLDTFGLVDEITLSMVEGFSGIRLTFGALRFEPSGSGEQVAIAVDGVNLGSGQGGLDRVPAGEHEVVLHQERPLGVWESRRIITLETDETLIVPLETPVLTLEEAALLDRAVADRQTAIVEGAVPAPPDQSVLELLRSEFFHQYRSQLADRYLAGLTTETAEGQRARDLPETNAPRQFPAWFTYSDRSIPDRFRRTPTLADSVSEHVNNMYRDDGTFGRYTPTFRQITVDGDDTDWDGIEPIRDYRDDANPLVLDDPRAADVVEVSIAYDYENLYLKFRTADRQYRRRNVGYKFHFNTATARVFIDLWPAEDTKPWTGYRPHDGERDSKWSSLMARSRMASTEGQPGSVLETSLPLETIVGSPHFTPSFSNLWSAVEYRGTGDHETVDQVHGFRSITVFLFPVAAYLAGGQDS